MRKQKTTVCLVVAAIGVSLLLQGNSAFAKEVDKNTEAEIVQATVKYYLKDNTTETKTTNSATKTYS